MQIGRSDTFAMVISSFVSKSTINARLSASIQAPENGPRDGSEPFVATVTIRLYALYRFDRFVPQRRPVRNSHFSFPHRGDRAPLC